jgi:YbgC/YbaW family acyl-CoA thioester hydrolase
MTTLPSVDLTVYPYECDAFGHLNHASVLTVFERARWESLAQGPGRDLFHRNGIVPVVRKANVDFRAAAFPGDGLRVDSVVIHRGTTSWTIRHTAKRASDGSTIAVAEIVFVCLDRAGRPSALPEELARLLGPRTGTHAVRIAVDDAEIAVDVRGSGAAVLFVHGFPFDRSMWRHQLAGLSRWKRIAPDLRGVGESSAPAEGYSIARYADDLIGVLDALEVDRTVVCGLSMGGYVAFELMRRYAARVSALILCDTRPEADTEEARRGREELVQLALERGAEAVGERLRPRLLAPGTLADQPDVVEQYREMTRRVSVPGMVGALRAMRDRPDSTRGLAEIRVPTLVLVGSDDQVTPPAVAEGMTRAIANAEMAVIPGAGHLTPLEQPLVTSRALEGFLERAL